MPRSVWANPFSIGKDGSRDEVIAKFRAYAADTELDVRAEILKGQTLLCHCEAHEACHADSLAEFAEGQLPERGLGIAADGLPERIGIRHEMHDPPATVQDGIRHELDDLPATVQEGNVVPSDLGWRGAGPPRQTAFMGQRREFADGGGSAPLAVGGQTPAGSPASVGTGSGRRFGRSSATESGTSEAADALRLNSCRAWRRVASSSARSRRKPCNACVRPCWRRCPCRRRAKA